VSGLPRTPFQCYSSPLASNHLGLLSVVTKGSPSSKYTWPSQPVLPLRPLREVTQALPTSVTCGLRVVIRPSPVTLWAPSANRSSLAFYQRKQLTPDDRRRETPRQWHSEPLQQTARPSRSIRENSSPLTIAVGKPLTIASVKHLTPAHTLDQEVTPLSMLQGST
jgi:hypothetical protein